MSTTDAEPVAFDLQRSLDALLQGAVGLVQEARTSMPVAEVMRLDEALESGRTHVAVTFVYPLGAVRVRIVGEWTGERNLWGMMPADPVIEREVQ